MLTVRHARKQGRSTAVWQHRMPAKWIGQAAHPRCATVALVTLGAGSHPACRGTVGIVHYRYRRSGSRNRGRKNGTSSGCHCRSSRGTVAIRTVAHRHCSTSPNAKTEAHLSSSVQRSISGRGALRPSSPHNSAPHSVSRTCQDSSRLSAIMALEGRCNRF